MLKIFKFILIFLLFVIACKKDCDAPTNPECSNYDPCYGEVETIAEIKIYDIPFAGAGELHPMWENEDISVAGDSAYGGITVFEATDLGPGTIYTWTLGEETIYDRVFSRSQFPRSSSIDISLKVEKEPNVSCFPNDNGVDSLTRTFHTFEQGRRPNYMGSFRGYFEHNPNEIIEFTIDTVLNGSTTRAIYHFPVEDCRFRISSTSFNYSVHQAYHKVLSEVLVPYQGREVCGSILFFYGRVVGNDAEFLFQTEINGDFLKFNGQKL